MTETIFKKEWLKTYKPSWWRKLYWKFFKRGIVVGIDYGRDDRTVKVYRKGHKIIAIEETNNN